MFWMLALGFEESAGLEGNKMGSWRWLAGWSWVNGLVLFSADTILSFLPSFGGAFLACLLLCQSGLRLLCLQFLH